MKKALLFIAMGMLLFAACKPKDKDVELRCDVNPDEVFGQHYSAWDFQIWYTLNSRDEAYAALLSKMDIDASYSNGHGLTFHKADSTELMDKALRACMDECDDNEVCYYPVCLDLNDSLAMLFFKYGIYAPDTELPLLDGSDIVSATATHRSDGYNELSFVFNEKATLRWAQITHDGIGRIVVIMLGDRVLSAPIINSEITGGRCSVTGDFTEDEVCALATILNNK